MVIPMTVDNIMVSHSDEHHKVHAQVSVDSLTDVLNFVSPIEIYQYLRDNRVSFKTIQEMEAQRGE